MDVRLPESTLALATELRDLARALEPARAELPAGSPVAKTISGGRYWYLQSRTGGLEIQRFLGPESPELLARLERWRDRRRELEPDLDQLARLNEMVVAGGVPRESAAATRVLELLAESGVFARGGVLVGTRAFAAYGPMLGFAAPAAARTQDIDLAVPREIAVAVPRDPAADLPARFAETSPPFLAVPDLDPRRASTSFKLRGRELRIDFVTARRPADPDRPVPIPAFGVAAWPLALAGYLLPSPLPAVVHGTRPVLVRVPPPGRFALHKLWLTEQRPATESARAAKDLAQARTMLSILLEDRPAEVEAAVAGLRGNPRAAAGVRRAARRLPAETAEPLVDLLAAAGR